MIWHHRIARAAFVVAALIGGPVRADGGVFINDYPTEARADYVFACMSVNGQSRQALSKCSCSIDIIASILPYEDYVSAETVLAMRLLGGEKSSVFRSTRNANSAVARLRRAQAEAEIRCFE